MLNTLVMVVSLVLIGQAALSLYLSLYTWMTPARFRKSQAPTTFEAPQLTFTALLPCRHEEKVIRQTIGKVARVNYPGNKFEIIVVTAADDVDTIEQAYLGAKDNPNHNIRIVTFTDGPINKPHGLNVALAQSNGQVVTIFDAEDDVHPDIFNVTNTVMLREKVRVVQCGVQLMNFQSHWYAIHNVLEYYFWFKSRLHFHSEVGMIPLGGNTVFMNRRLLNEIGGWDENCLTEDADIGIRLSARGEPIRVIYDHEHATREETPDTLESFIKQRTRWHQGFIQVLRKGEWRKLPNRGQRVLAFYTLVYPLVQGAFTMFWPFSLVLMLFSKLSVPVAMISYGALYLMGFNLLFSLLALMEFCKSYKLKLPLRTYPVAALGFIPFQLVLGISALRAVWRVFLGQQNWEKTYHKGAHRVEAVESNDIL